MHALQYFIIIVCVCATTAHCYLFRSCCCYHYIGLEAEWKIENSDAICFDQYFMYGCHLH